MLMLNDNTVLIHNLPIHFVSTDRAIELIAQHIEDSRKINVITPYATFWRYAELDSEFKHAWEDADLVLPDGISVLWAKVLKERNYSRIALIRLMQLFVYGIYLFFLIATGRFEKKFNLSRVTGVELVTQLLELANKNSWRVYFLGGWHSHLGQLHKNIHNAYPQLKYRVDEDISRTQINSAVGKKVLNDAISRINSFSPQVLVVSLSPPFQEKWICSQKNTLSANVVIGAGATVDFLSGRLERAPYILRKSGLEWFWRLISQPTRIRRILYAFPYFPLKMLIYVYKTAGNTD